MLDLKSVKPSKADREWAMLLLANWKTLNSGSPQIDHIYKLLKKVPRTLGECTIDDVSVLLAVELETKRRLPILERLVTRYSSLEALENQRELMRQMAISSEDRR